uniref:Minor capsid protein P9 transmembrane helices domain-containing protein n=1 Tax=viral metagenome TaxID=1070528 RepID=A0A6C0CGV4_9ZZZZ
MDEHEEVWVESPADLLKRLVLLPSRGNSFGAKVNALTRLLVVVVVVLAVLKWRYWPAILAIGIFLILFLYLLKEGKLEIEHFDEDMANLRHYTTPLSNLYAQGACEIEVVKDIPQVATTEEVKKQPHLMRKNPSPRDRPVVNIRRPKTAKIMVNPKDSGVKKDAYDQYQASYDYERAHAPPTLNYSGL